MVEPIAGAVEDAHAGGDAVAVARGGGDFAWSSAWLDADRVARALPSRK